MGTSRNQAVVSPSPKVVQAELRSGSRSHLVSPHKRARPRHLHALQTDGFLQRGCQCHVLCPVPRSAGPAGATPRQHCLAGSWQADVHQAQPASRAHQMSPLRRRLLDAPATAAHVGLANREERDAKAADVLGVRSRRTGSPRSCPLACHASARPAALLGTGNFATPLGSAPPRARPHCSRAVLACTRNALMEADGAGAATGWRCK